MNGPSPTAAIAAVESKTKVRVNLYALREDRKNVYLAFGVFPKGFLFIRLPLYSIKI
jgi:hypothetical protein